MPELFSAPDVGAYAHLQTDELFPIALPYSAQITKADETEGSWTIEGYVATSGLDLQDDIITPQGQEFKFFSAVALESPTKISDRHDFESRSP